MSSSLSDDMERSDIDPLVLVGDGGVKSIILTTPMMLV